MILIGSKCGDNGDYNFAVKHRRYFIVRILDTLYMSRQSICYSLLMVESEERYLHT